MRIAFLILGIFSSFILGFIFAGLFGAFCFAIILTLTVYLFNQKSGNKLSGTGIARTFFTLLLLGYLLMYVGGLIGAEKEILKKLDLIKKELKSNGHRTMWVIISQKRISLFNSLLKKSAKESWHIKGKAIDIYVFDINGDNLFTKEDIKILEKANESVEKKTSRTKRWVW